MKYSYTATGLLALAYGSAITIGAAVPKTEDAGVHIMSVGKDWERIHSHSRRALEGRGQTFGPDKLNYEYYWFANATAGGEKVDVLLDTGSADLWLVSPKAGTGATQGVQTWRPVKAADTTLMKGQTFNIGYGEGGNGVSGPVYKSPVCIGTACTTMAVGSATKDEGLGTFPRSGIMGLAFQGGNSVRPTQQPTFMESLQSKLKAPVFALNFSYLSDASQIAFGGNPFKGVGTYHKVKVDQDIYGASWSVNAVTYSKDGQDLGTFDVVFDTGGPTTTASEPIVRAYYDGIVGAKDVNGDAGTWTVPCGTKLPDLTLTLHGQTLIIQGKNFYLGNKATTGDCQTWFSKENSPTRGLVGDPFYISHVAVYNQADQTISWAKQAHQD